MVKFKMWLIVLWLGGFIFLFTVILLQTIFGAYGNMFWEAWKWLAQTLIPPISLIIGVIFSNSKIQIWRHTQIHQFFPNFQQRKIELLKDLHNLLSEKIERLRKSYTIETNSKTQIILQQEIQQAETEQENIEKEIIVVENLRDKNSIRSFSFWFKLIFFLSSFYLTLLSVCILVKPFISSYTSVELLEISIPFVIPFQGLIIVILVIFFLNNIEEP